MPKKIAKKFRKHPAKMTSEELARHVFHPRVLKAAKEHVKRLNAPEPPRTSSKPSSMDSE